MGTLDLRTLRSPPVSLNQERQTQRRKATNFIFILFIFCDENPLKSPPWKHTWWSEHFEKFPKKKTKSPHFQEGKKKSFEIATFWGEKKQVLKSLRFVKDLGRLQAFFFWNTFMKGVLTLTPLPQGGRPDGQTLKILYIVGTRDLRALWSPPVSLNLVHVLVFSTNFLSFYFLCLCVFFFYYYFL